MKSPTRRVLLGVAAFLVVGAGIAVAAVAAAPGGGPAGSSAGPASTGPATPTAQPTDDLAVAAPSAPASQIVEPAPGVEVATDPSTTTEAAGSLDVVVTSAEQEGSAVVVYGFVQGVVTDDGTCSATASRPGEADVVASGPAFADATTTGCEPVSIPVSSLSAGSWSVVLSWSSGPTTGSSSATSVAVTR